MVQTRFYHTQNNCHICDQKNYLKVSFIFKNYYYEEVILPHLKKNFSSLIVGCGKEGCHEKYITFFLIEILTEGKDFIGHKFDP